MILLYEYSPFNFELNIELNHFLARFNVKMNYQNLSAVPSPNSPLLKPLMCAQIVKALPCHELTYVKLTMTDFSTKLATPSN